MKDYVEQSKKLTLSLIIPAYNEERHIKACLDAVANQTRMADEVILVDNNCTDKTIEIAKTYDFVRIIQEKNQGRGYARSAGFDAAKSDIIGRIDVDSKISSNWVELVLDNFTKDPNLSGVTGIAYTDILPFTHLIKSTYFSRAYFWFAHAGFNTMTMWGANMAVHRSSWQQVRDSVVKDDRIVHEDQDISLWMAALGMKIAQDNKLLITTNGQSYRYLPKLLQYVRLHERTKRLHRKNGNLKSEKLLKIGVIRSFPGRLLGALVGMHLLIISIIPFPIDYFVFNILKNKDWLD